MDFSRQSSVSVFEYAIEVGHNFSSKEFWTHSAGEGEGGMIWENGTETCILSCKKRIASLGLYTGYRMLGAGTLG